MRLLTRSGAFIEYDWISFDPAINIKAKERAELSLKKQGTEGQVYEVAPECFWYKTDKKEVNCGLY